MLEIKITVSTEIPVKHTAASLVCGTGRYGRRVPEQCGNACCDKIYGRTLAEPNSNTGSTARDDQLTVSRRCRFLLHFLSHA